MMNIPLKSDILQAYNRISHLIHRTPVMTSANLDALFGFECFFKCENFQKVGAFKIRGATNAVLSMEDSERAHGVATHSSGNHAQALALAARQVGIKAYIVMPENAPRVKVAAVKGYGAEIYFCAPTLPAREEMLARVVNETGATFIPPYDDYRIIAGQATAGLELFEQVPDLDFLFCPVGGGGLLSGIALAKTYFAPTVILTGAEPSGADDAKRSLDAGYIIPSTSPNTIADGLLTSLGQKNFEIINNYVDAITTGSDQEILEAMTLIWERLKIVVEPSGAVPLAAAIKMKDQLQNKKVGIMISGGNLEVREMIKNYYQKK
ncbi:MAG: pyridoxal-phosphate dependent enzyme [Candidatus Cyclobacteriaceae bacterium M3_2C_046]